MLWKHDLYAMGARHIGYGSTVYRVQIGHLQTLYRLRREIVQIIFKLYYILSIMSHGSNKSHRSIFSYDDCFIVGR